MALPGTWGTPMWWRRWFVLLSVLLPRPVASFLLAHRAPSITARCRPCTACAGVPQLPEDFLTDKEFARRSTAHRHIEQLRIDAPRTLSAAPTASIFAEGISLRGDLGQPLAQGREAYLAAFAAVARFSSSPFLPLELGALSCDFEPGDEALLVRWRTTVALRGATPTPLTGESVYEIDASGQLCTHTLRELRFGQRRLLSSTLGAWLALVQERSPASPAEALQLLAETLQLAAAPPPPPPAATAPSAAAPSASLAPPSSSTTSSSSLATAAASKEDAPPRVLTVPPPGSVLWPRYAALHLAAAALLGQFGALLESEVDLALYTEAVELKAATGEVLIKGAPQYSRLLESLRKAHQALSASPLLTHSYQYQMRALPPPQANEAAGQSGGGGAAARGEAGGGALPSLCVAWRYSLRSAAGGGPPELFSLEADSAFQLVEAAERGEASGGAAAPPPAAPPRVAAHTLRSISLNGRPALPEVLLQRLRPGGGGGGGGGMAVEPLQLLSGAFLTVSETMLAPVPVPAAKPAASAAALGAAAAPPTAAYALNFLSLLSALHAWLGASAPSSPPLDACAAQVEVRGLLRERLLQGRPGLERALAAARQAYGALAGERGAVQTGEAPLKYSLQVTAEADVLVVWEAQATLGQAPLALLPASPLRVGLPLALQGRARLRLDAQTGLVREVWVQELAVNEQPLLPEQLIKWVRLGSEGLSPDVATILRSLTPWLES